MQIKFMALVILRTAIIFITLLIIMRLMGKRQIGEMQPYELVITLLIAELACIPMADTTIPLLYGVVSILTIYLLHQIVCIMDLNAKGLKIIVSGKPSVVINKNGVDYTQLKKNNLDICDLIECMRTAGYFSLDSVDYALYEANGSFSALPKKDYDKEELSLPVLIIDKGKFEKDNIKMIHQSISFFEEILKKHNAKSVKDIIVMTVDGNGKIYMQEKGKKYESFKVTLKENGAW